MKISIITATWNSAATIRDTIESVLSQSYPDWEHIIVDGGSQDNTLDIVKEYETAYNGRLRYLSEKDRGIYDAMNKGIRLATGDVVGLLNSDDFYSSNNILESIAANIGSVDAVYGDIHYVNPADLGKCVRKYSSAKFKRSHMRMGFMPAHPSFYCRRALYSSIGLFNLEFKIAADFEQLLRLIYVNKIQTKYIPLDFVTMRTGGASTSGLESHKQILKDHLRTYRLNGVNSGVCHEMIRYAVKLSNLIAYKLHLTSR